MPVGGVPGPRCGSVARKIENSVRALILSVDPGQPLHLLLPPERWAAGRVFELERDSELHYLRGVQVVLRGDDYVLAAFERVPAPD